MNLENIDWVIVGGESGRKARPMQEWWFGVLNNNARNRKPLSSLNNGDG